MSSQGVEMGPALGLSSSDQSPATPSYSLTLIAVFGIATVGGASLRALIRRRPARGLANATTLVLPRIQ